MTIMLMTLCFLTICKCEEEDKWVIIETAGNSHAGADYCKKQELLLTSPVWKGATDRLCEICKIFFLYEIGLSINIKGSP